jgi:hypothetical protein
MGAGIPAPIQGAIMFCMPLNVGPVGFVAPGPVGIRRCAPNPTGPGFDPCGPLGRDSGRHSIIDLV